MNSSIALSFPTDVRVVGYGSAGRAFTLALQRAGFSIAGVADKPGSPGFCNAVSDNHPAFPTAELPLDSGWLVLATPDQAIRDTAAMLAGRSGEKGKHSLRIALHLSGALGLEPLQPLADAGWRAAAFHPIQTFPPGSGAERFAGIHAGISVEDAILPQLLELARRLGVQPLVVPEMERARYHLASVLVSNFLPLLLELGADCLGGIANHQHSAADALLPLMRGMLDSLARHSPGESMTGPVARNDLAIVRAHLQVIGDPAMRELYRGLTRALVGLAVKSGRLTDPQANGWIEMLK